MQIQYLTDGPLPLYRQYASQTQEQTAYVELDCDQGTLTADYNAEIGNAVPSSVWHGLTLRFAVSPMLTTERVNNILNELAPIAERVVIGFEKIWDGDNHVGKFDDDAWAAREEMEAICEETWNEESEWAVWGVEDWLYQSKSDLVERMKNGETIADLATELTDEAEAERVHLIGNLAALLERWSDGATRQIPTIERRPTMIHYNGDILEALATASKDDRFPEHERSALTRVHDWMVSGYETGEYGENVTTHRVGSGRNYDVVMPDGVRISVHVHEAACGTNVGINEA